MGSQERANENFREAFRKYINDDLFTQARLLPADVLAANVDEDRIARNRMERYKQESQGVRKLTERTEEADSMQKLRDKWRSADNTLDARDFLLEDNICAIYFNAYGEGFYGQEYPDNPNDGWRCPRCGLLYMVSLKTLKDRCERCGRETPLGELKKDKILRR